MITLLRMGNRCRVTFHDKELSMNRTLEVRGDSPTAAAQAAFQWMQEHAIWTGDFDEKVKVEVVTTIEHTIPLEAIRKRISHVGEIERIKAA